MRKGARRLVFSKEVKRTADCGIRSGGGGLSRFSCRRDGGGRTLGGHSSDHRFMRRARDEKFRNVLPTGGGKIACLGLASLPGFNYFRG